VISGDTLAAAQIPTANHPTRDFIHWRNQADGNRYTAAQLEVRPITESVTFLAVNGYTATFSGGTGNLIGDTTAMVAAGADNRLTETQIPTANHPALPFVYWTSSTNANIYTTAQLLNRPFTGHVIFTAQFGHTVTFDGGTGTLTGSPTAMVADDGMLRAAQLPTASHATENFVRWVSNTNPSNIYTRAELLARPITEDVTFTARFGQAPHWVGFFDAAGALNGGKTQTNAWVFPGENLTMDQIPTASHATQIFTHWESVVYPPNFYTTAELLVRPITEDVAFMPRFELPTHTVTFAGCTGSWQTGELRGGQNPATVTAGGNLTAAQIPTTSRGGHIYRWVSDATPARAYTRAELLMRPITADVTFTVQYMRVAQGTILGQVRDATNRNALSGADVVFTAWDGTITTTTTDALGFFSVEGLAHGSYIVTASKAGFSTEFRRTWPNSSEVRMLDLMPGGPEYLLTVTTWDLNNTNVTQVDTPADYALTRRAGTNVWYRRGTAPMTELVTGIETGFFITAGTPAWTGRSGHLVLNPADGDIVAGVIQGQVRQIHATTREPSGLNNMDVVITATDGAARQITTDPGGFFFVEGFAPGTYTVTVSGEPRWLMEGSVFEIATVTAGAGTNVVLDFAFGDGSYLLVVEVPGDGNPTVTQDGVTLNRRTDTNIWYRRGTAPMTEVVTVTESGFVTRSATPAWTGRSGHAALTLGQDTPVAGVIQGQVRDITDGRGLVGAAVVITAPDGTITRTTTGPGGLFHLDGFAPGTYIVTASKPGFTTEFTTAVVTATASAHVTLDLTPDPPPTYTLIVQVLGGGNPTVTQADPSGDYVLTRYGTTNFWHRIGTAPMTGEVTIAQPGFGTMTGTPVWTGQHGWLSLSISVPPPPPPVIQGRVVHDINGAGLAGATIEIRNAAHTVVASLTTDSGGYFWVDGLNAGTYTVLATLAGLIPNFVAVTITDTEGANVVLRLTVTPPPPPTYLLEVQVTGGGNPTVTQAPGDVALTRRAGTNIWYRIGTAPMTGLVTVSESGLISDTGTPVWTGTSAWLALHLIPDLPTTFPIKGQVRDITDLSGLAGATVVIRDSAGTVVETLITDQGGYFYATDFAPGTYTVMASRIDFSPEFITVTVTATAGADVTLELMSNISVSYVLVVEVIGGVNPTVTQANSWGNDILHRDGTTNLWFNHASAPLTGVVTVSEPGFITASGTPDATGWLSLTLEPVTMPIQGQVRDITDLSGLAGATVVIRDSAGTVAETLTTDQDGYFSADGFAPGQYTVTVSMTGFSTEFTVVTVTATAGASVTLGLPSIPPPTYTLEVEVNGGNNPTVTQDGIALTRRAGTNIWYRQDTAPMIGVITASESGFETETGTPTWTGQHGYVALTLVRGPHLPPFPVAIQGQVINEDTGTGLAGATVTITVFDGTVVETAMTDADGFFSVDGFAPGTYTVTASLTGFSTEFVAVTVTAAADANVTLELTPDSPEPPTYLLEVEVTGVGNPTVTQDGVALTRRPGTNIWYRIDTAPMTGEVTVAQPGFGTVTGTPVWAEQAGHLVLTLRQFAVVYDLNGGNAGGYGHLAEYVALDEFPANVPTGMTRVGYTFLHWVDEVGDQVDPGTIQITRDRTFAAVWEYSGPGIIVPPLPLAVVYNLNGGNIDSQLAVTDYVIPGDVSVNVPTGMIRDGYVFSHWTDATGATVNPAAVTITDDTTFTAQWTPLHTITFAGGAGTLTGDLTATVTENDTLDATQIPMATRPNHVFLHWVSDAPPANTYTMAELLARPITAGVTFTAYFEPIMHTVTFDFDGGYAEAHATVTEDFAAGQSIGSANVPVLTRADYDFDGWRYTDQAADTPNLTGEQVGERVVRGAITFTAQWLPADSGDDGGDHGDDGDDIDNQAPEESSSQAFLIGSPDGRINPGGTLTRAEVATIFFRLMSDEARAYYWAQENPFDDVAPEEWYNNAISTTLNMQLFGDVTDNNFAPNQNITRGELAAVLVRFMIADEIGQFTVGEDQFNDLDDHWAREYINLAAEQGWVEGDEGLGGGFRPEDTLTRAEAAAMINRIFGRLIETEECRIPDMITFPDNVDEEAWYFLYIYMATNSYTYQLSEDNNGYKTLTGLIALRDWTVLERPDSRPEHILP